MSAVALGAVGALALKSEALPCDWWKEIYYQPGTRIKVGECGLSCLGGPYCWGTFTESSAYFEGPCGNCEAQR
ncbi:MAG TPA: hypothetical protein VFO85_18710 [Vicinamibacteria bacterium]|nr:hypothetical protein [Vicinamibacteria bacterium]